MSESARDDLNVVSISSFDFEKQSIAPSIYVDHRLGGFSLPDEEATGEVNVEWWRREGAIALSATGDFPDGHGGGEYHVSLALAPEAAARLGRQLVEAADRACSDGENDD